ncbi:MAG: acyltransferase [Thermoanaerobaculia bacterium]|jgi:hypothetical protein
MKAASIAEGHTYRPFIDGLRGIAILMVVSVHTSQWCGNGGPETAHVPGMKDLIDAGARGVQLFFLLSAFTLFASSKNRFRVDRFPRLASSRRSTAWAAASGCSSSRSSCLFPGAISQAGGAFPGPTHSSSFSRSTNGSVSDLES